MPSAQHMSAIKQRKLRTAVTNAAIRSIMIERNWFDNGEIFSSDAIDGGHARLSPRHDRDQAKFKEPDKAGAGENLPRPPFTALQSRADRPLPATWRCSQISHSRPHIGPNSSIFLETLLTVHAEHGISTKLETSMRL
jgi:hypothetical protein